MKLAFLPWIECKSEGFLLAWVSISYQFYTTWIRRKYFWCRNIAWTYPLQHKAMLMYNPDLSLFHHHGSNWLTWRKASIPNMLQQSTRQSTPDHEPTALLRTMQQEFLISEMTPRFNSLFYSSGFYYSGQVCCIVHFKPTSFPRTSCCFSRSSVQAPEGTTLSPICPAGRGELQSERKKKGSWCLPTYGRNTNSYSNGGYLQKEKGEAENRSENKKYHAKKRTEPISLCQTIKKKTKTEGGRACQDLPVIPWRACWGQREMHSFCTQLSRLLQCLHTQHAVSKASGAPLFLCLRTLLCTALHCCSMQLLCLYSTSTGTRCCLLVTLSKAN